MSLPLILPRQSKIPVYLVVFLLVLFVAAAQAKDAPVTVNAIALFDSPEGPAYVQITGLMLNGKTEMRSCDGIPRFDKHTYDEMMRVQLAGATSLERNADGVLMLSAGTKPTCVVPSGLKFEHNAALTPAEAAEQALIQGNIISSWQPGMALPAFKPGMQLVFVEAPDTELADYLRAQRANTIKDWQDFLSRHPSSGHAGNARNAIAEILERGAEATFTQYQQSGGTRKADLALLKQAREQAQEANRAASGFAAAIRLIETISRELDALLEMDRNRLAAFRKSLETQSGGLQPLVAAMRHSKALLEVRPDYAPVINLHRDIVHEEEKMGKAIESAESLATDKHYDEALAALGPYRMFAGDLPRIETLVTAAYTYHLNQGRDFAARQNWEQASAEFKKALSIRPNDAEATASVKNADTQIAEAHNQQKLEQALQQSKDYASRKEFIEAYEVLAELPESQRLQVSEQMAALQKDYVAAAFKRAQKLEQMHIPITNHADEDAVLEAHDLLERASSLSGDPAMQVKLDLLDDKISSHYVEVAQRYLQKPLGSGVGVGWLYLNEAQRYRSTNEQTIKDAMARYSPAYQLRARLSVGIVLRDQTSRRDSSGFTDQLVDAIAGALEASDLGVKVVRQPKESDPAQPNFLLTGEIREHRVLKNSSMETMASKYRAGTHDVKNPEWIQANQQFDAAKQKLVDAQSALTDAQAQHKKKDVIAAASDAVQAAQKAVDDARHKVETTDQNRVEAVIEPYNYTRKNVEVAGLIDLGFRITDQSGKAIETDVNIKKEDRKTGVVLENVKPEDTEGVTLQNTEPDEAQFLTDLETVARDELVKSVREEAAALPAKILQEARDRAQRGDTDGAAEEYVLYLNACANKPTPERAEAMKFLHDQLNVKMAASN
jgi:tetratricopeptide (TPR) repeat protein